MTAPELKRIIQKVSTGATLTDEEIEAALDIMSSGAATPVQMGAFLMALRVRGETVEEITGAARLLRSRMLTVNAPAGAVDIVGTGGDSHGTYNVSTCASLVAAGAGLKIAKHGNRRIAQPLVVAEMAAGENQLGTQFARSPTGHPAMNAKRLRLVGCRQHHPAAHGDGLAAQRRVEQLLNRGVKRIEIGMKNGGFHRCASRFRTEHKMNKFDRCQFLRSPRAGRRNELVRAPFQRQRSTHRPDHSEE